MFGSPFIYVLYFLQNCSPPALVLSLSPGLGPDGLPSPGGYPHRGAVSSNGSGSCSGSPPPYPGSTSINFQQQRHARERGTTGSNNGLSTATTERTGLNGVGTSRNSPFNNELLAAAMRSNSEIPNISANLLSPRLRASINDESDIKRELDSPTPKRPRISVSSQDLLDQLSVVHEGARRLVTSTGSLAALDHTSSPPLSGIAHPPPTRSPLARRGPLRTVILNPGNTNQRWITGGGERNSGNNNDPGSIGGYQPIGGERGSRTVHTRRSPHNSHHNNYYSHREHYHNVRRSPHHYHHYHNQNHILNRRNTRQRERERERNRAAALAAARAVAANLQDSFSDILGDEVST